jgi:iron complex transport system ATP-binding protein
MSQLQVHNLTLSYGEATIIEELSMTVPSGQVTALIGPNGCGKSTLLRGLSRLLTPRKGAVILDGQSIHKIPAKQLAKQLGILPQSPTAPEGLTVYELAAQGRYSHQGWLQQWSVQDEQITREALETTGMLELADRSLDTLSGGQRQRAWIAMTLAQKTDILLLDEPTTFLDMAHQIEVLDLLHDLNQRGNTIVMVLHDLNQACRYADYLVVMKAGKIYAHGDPATIVTEKTVYDVFGLECCIIPDPVAGTPVCIPLGRKRVKAALHGAPLAELVPQVEQA